MDKIYYVVVDSSICTRCNGWDWVVRKVFTKWKDAQNWINSVDANRSFFIRQIAMDSYDIKPSCLVKRKYQDVLYGEEEGKIRARLKKVKVKS